MARWKVAFLAALAAPLVMGAADPRGDVGPCPGLSGGGRPPDLVAASGRATEEGNAIEWTMRFARPLQVPDRVGRPFRVDVTVRDPSVPSVSFAFYRRLNRIVRFDAVTPLGLHILALPEHGADVYFNVQPDGNTLTMLVPGRMLTRDVDLAGPRLARLRWSVVVRDGGSCDFLGDGSPSLRLTPDASSAPASVVPSAIAPASSGDAAGGREEGGFGPVFRVVAIGGAIAVLAIAIGALVLGRRPRGGAADGAGSSDGP